MFQPLVRTLLSAALLAPCCLAQTTWVVDALNGPGTDFLNLTPAIAASSSGDVIVIRSGGGGQLLPGATITHGLTIVGESSKPGLLGNLDIQVPAGEHVVLRSLRVVSFGTTNLNVTNCAGSVHLQDIEMIGNAHAPLNFNVNGCALLTMTNCFMVRYSIEDTQFVDCDLVSMRDCTISNGSGADFFVSNSRVVAIDSSFAGLPVSLFYPNGRVAMHLDDSVLELAGGSEVDGAPNNKISSTGASSVLVGPTAIATQLGAPAAPATITTIGAFIDNANSMDVVVHGVPFGIGVLSYGNPASAPVPLWGDSYWLDVPSVVVFDFVLLDANGAASWQANLPATLPAGLSLWLQTAVWQSGVFSLSTPAVVTTPA